MRTALHDGTFHRAWLLSGNRTGYQER